MTVKCNVIGPLQGQLRDSFFFYLFIFFFYRTFIPAVQSNRDWRDSRNCLFFRRVIERGRIKCKFSRDSKIGHTSPTKSKDPRRGLVSDFISIGKSLSSRIFSLLLIISNFGQFFFLVSKFSSKLKRWKKNGTCECENSVEFWEPVIEMISFSSSSIVSHVLW